MINRRMNTSLGGAFVSSRAIQIVHKPCQRRLNDSYVDQLIKDSERHIYRIALKITRNVEDAEDVRQEALLKMHQKIGQFEGRSQITTWAYRIAFNEALMCLRKRQVHIPLDELLADETAANASLHSTMQGPESAYSHKELSQSLARAIAQLRPVHRGTFLSRAVEQLSTTEAARALKIPESTVKARLRRARKQLKLICNQLSGCRKATI
jgi:RNA polymerase sigma-70 factor (ECF subfamily)